MDSNKPTLPLKPSSSVPSQHHVPPVNAVAGGDGSRNDDDDMSGPLSPPHTGSSAAASLSQTRVPSMEVLSPRGVFQQLRDAHREGAQSVTTPITVIGTPTVGRVSPMTRFRGDRQRPGAGLRSHSPTGYESDDSVPLNLLPSPAYRTSPTTSLDAFPAVRPKRQHSVIATEGKRYKPVADHPLPNRSFYPFATAAALPLTSFSSPLRQDDSRIPESERNMSLLAAAAVPSVSQGDRVSSEGRDNIVKAYLRGDTVEDSESDANNPINNFTFFVGASDADRSSSASSGEDEDVAGGRASARRPTREAHSTASKSSFLGSTAGNEPGEFVANKSMTRPLDVREAEKFVETLKRSFAIQRNRNAPSLVATPMMRGDGVLPDGGGEVSSGGRISPFGEKQSSTTFPTGGGDGWGGMPIADFAFDEEKAQDNYMRQPMHEALRCVSRENLDDDTVSFKAAWESLKSEAFSRNILFGFRVTAFAVFPTFLLVEHPKTRDYFVAGALVPIIAGLFVRPSLGAMMFMIALALQGMLFFMTWGVVLNAVGVVNSPGGWWCCVFFTTFSVSLLGQVAAKRLMMVYTLIIMQMEHSPGGDEVDFACRFAWNFIVACCFALLATILPYPTFTYRQANEGIKSLHKLYSAGVGNAMKSFWAPVRMDAKMALSQIPFNKISGLTATVRVAVNFSSYEPTEFNLNNTLRGQRLAMLQRIKMHIYAMSAASGQRLSNSHSVHRSQVRNEIKEFEKRMQGPAMKLAAEVMKVLTQVGAYIAAKDVVANVSFDAMAESAMIFSDFMEKERMEMLFLRKLPVEETNACLQCFAFHFSLIDIATELQRFEQAMKNFDPAQYPSMLRRALNFFFLDLWNNFWDELPHRLTLDRPYDVRLLKDSFRYAGAFTVACAFTLNYDKNNVYFFGMAILLRLAQQTASETLAMGTNRICGLCIGASLAYITVNKTHNLTELTLLSMVWCFIAMCFSQHPNYGFGAQYVLVTCIAGLRLASTPTLLLNRITDNVFAFISYYIICTFIFPVDPIRVLWNTRTKCFISMNDLAQTIVTIGCAPITMDGKEVDFLIAKARATVSSQQLLLKAYAEWMGKSATEPTLRGGVYPAAACARLRLNLNEIASLEEALVGGVARLHRPREQPPSVVLRDMLELTRPFLLDAGRLIHQILQSIIDATERHRTWSMEEPLHLMWKSQLACRSLHQVTGNIQRNFYAAIQQVSAPDKELLNVYLNSSAVEDAFMHELDPSVLLNKDNEDLVQRILAMSFHASKDAVVSRDDLQAFNAIIIVFELLLKTLSQLLPPMIEIYEFEKSRHIDFFKKTKS
ncbi:hypothetical protein ABB37_01214 [Leptomonas pyrrhocoris]|uniref:Integral membrane bound transporter domain-containing protein n=1 Tax=Leptomonas pyrrhocoris TaxID=157538 RepID=A0A0N0DZ00_LEPPY|nr:hypothetical protein ABB37_01214 [Leptomonas pyrrhocoris]KPA84712.1 hypothetical protein ABB37_01214 [Leptomonas pyrrhocoris]|eukprot:XP_015663151.1 hypothetical protein ABB37_01214 [Leptomonas pyrrhocoris]